MAKGNGSDTNAEGALSTLHAISSSLPSTSPPPKYGFHLQIQEAELKNLLSGFEAYSYRWTEFMIASGNTDELESTRRLEKQEMNSSTGRFETTCARAGVVRDDFARKRADLDRLQDDRETMAGRANAARFRLQRERRDLKLKAVRDLFRTEICGGLFEGFKFDFKKDYKKELEEKPNTLPQGSQTHSMALRYKTELQEMEDKLNLDLAKYTATGALFECHLHQMHLFVATAEVQVGEEILALRDELGELTRRLRAIDAEDRDAQESYMVKWMKLVGQSTEHFDALPGIARDIERAVLQLIILSKGT